MQIEFKKCTLADADTLRHFAADIFYKTFTDLNTPENMAAY